MQKKNKFVATILTAAILSAVAGYCLHFNFKLLERYAYELRFFSVNNENKQQIVLVLIDDETLAKKGNYPFKRSAFADAIKQILKGDPRVIGIDIFFDGIKDVEDDLKLVNELDKSDKDIVLAVYPVEADNLLTNEIKSSSSGVYRYKNVSLGDVQSIFKRGFNGMDRGWMIPFIDRRHEKEFLPFPIVIASKYLKADYKQQPLFATIGGIQIREPANMLINYIGNTEAFDVVSFEKVTATDPSRFQDKIVLIGTSADIIGDNFNTPVSKRTPGVVIHANTIHTIINNRFITEIPLWCQIITVFLICLVMSLTVILARPLFSLVVSALAIIISKIIIDVIFAKYSLYFSYSPVVLSGIFIYLGTFLWSRTVKQAEEKKGGGA